MPSGQSGHHRAALSRGVRTRIGARLALQIRPQDAAQGRDCGAPQEGLAGRDCPRDPWAGGMDEGLRLVSYYIALIHKEPGSGYGVSFPDVPGVTTAGETLAEAMEQAADVLAFRCRRLGGADRPALSRSAKYRRNPSRPGLGRGDSRRHRRGSPGQAHRQGGVILIRNRRSGVPRRRGTDRPLFSRSLSGIVRPRG